MSVKKKPSGRRERGKLPDSIEDPHWRELFDARINLDDQPDDSGSRSPRPVAHRRRSGSDRHRRKSPRKSLKQPDCKLRADRQFSANGRLGQYRRGVAAHARGINP